MDHAMRKRNDAPDPEAQSVLTPAPALPAPEVASMSAGDADDALGRLEKLLSGVSAGRRAIAVADAIQRDTRRAQEHLTELQRQIAQAEAAQATAGERYRGETARLEMERLDKLGPLDAQIAAKQAALAQANAEYAQAEKDHAVLIAARREDLRLIGDEERSLRDNIRRIRQGLEKVPVGA
jgi:multidrug resistance efflux pump